MIEYDGGKWQVWFIFSLRGSVFPKSVVWAFFSSAAAFFIHPVLKDLSNDDSLSSVWGSFLFVLGFLVVFRTQQAYSRFWEGATILQQVRGEWFNAASSLVAFSNPNTDKQNEVEHFQAVLVRLMSLLYCTALQQVAMLRDEAFDIINIEGIDTTALDYLASMPEQKCEILLQWIQRLVVDNMRAGTVDIPPPILSRVFQELSRGIVNVINAQKVTDILFPFPYAQMVTLMLLGTTFATPLINCLLVTSRYWAASTTFISVFSFWSINYIAAEIELPFGDDPNDLPIRDLQSEMNKNLLMLLHKRAQQPPNFNDPPGVEADNWRLGTAITMKCPKELVSSFSGKEEDEQVAKGGLMRASKIASVLVSRKGSNRKSMAVRSGQMRDTSRTSSGSPAGTCSPQSRGQCGPAGETIGSAADRTSSVSSAPSPTGPAALSRAGSGAVVASAPISRSGSSQPGHGIATTADVVTILDQHEEQEPQQEPELPPPAWEDSEDRRRDAAGAEVVAALPDIERGVVSGPTQFASSCSRSGADGVSRQQEPQEMVPLSQQLAQVSSRLEEHLSQMVREMQLATVSMRLEEHLSRIVGEMQLISTMSLRLAEANGPTSTNRENQALLLPRWLPVVQDDTALRPQNPPVTPMPEPALDQSLRENRLRPW